MKSTDAPAIIFDGVSFHFWIRRVNGKQEGEDNLLEVVDVWRAVDAVYL